MNLWITYKQTQIGLDRPNEYRRVYYDIALFDDELTALRHANAFGAKAIEIKPGQTLEEAILG